MATRNYNASTRGRIADIKNGMFVESSESEFDVWGEKVQRYYFTVHNRVIIHAMFAEVTETIAGAVQTVFNYIQTTPSISLAALSSVHASIDTYVPGTRATYIGGSVAAAAITLSTGAISYLPSTIPTILGVGPIAGVESVGKIGFLSSVVDATDGTLKFGILYTPLDNGAYIEKLI
jgi:hypothetical protein